MTQLRKDALCNSHVYHIYTRSIAKYIVFNDVDEFERMWRLIDLYCHQDFTYKYSQFNSLSPANQKIVIDDLKISNHLLVDIIAYCLMPTHIHLILRQNTDDGISKYMSRILNGYSRYFNTKHQRVGPLWSSRFKNGLVSTDEQLLHLSRYVHLNPSSAGIINDLDDWKYSSYHEYVEEPTIQICNFKIIIGMNAKEYTRFVNDHKDYQRNLSIIKFQMMDNYAG